MTDFDRYEVTKNHPVPFRSGLKLSIFGPFGVLDFFIFLFGILLTVGISMVIPPLPIGGEFRSIVGRIYILFPILILFIALIARDPETKQPLFRALKFRYELRKSKIFTRNK